MPRHRVMISSTARDLPEHREQVRLACERAGFAPHDMMEHLTALNADAIDASLRMVAEADVYVGIFAYRYGYVPDGNDISITEMEYNLAVELDKPRLIFFIHEKHPVLGKDFEIGSGATKLQILKDRIGRARVAAFFRSPEDLRAHVFEALNNLGKELDIAAASGDAVASTVAKLHRKTSIPALPEPYIAHPYTLLQSRDLVGRQAELNALTDWVAKPVSKIFDARIFCFIAIGGMGKSALTWKWFNQIAPNEMKSLAGQMWWSFYESDATFENFLNRSLCYVSGQSEEEVRALPWQEREAQLLQHLNEKAYLLALDGLERVLIAYNRMDASRLADDEIDQQTANWVAGVAGLPATAAQSFIGQHRLRQTTDPRAGAFLRKLAQVSRSRVLISSRLYPNELQSTTGYPRPGCFAYFLRGLSDNDALALWRALNVSGSRQELVSIFRSVENHPLLVQALASEVANYKKAPGDFAAWRADHPQFDPTRLSLVQSRSHILEFALKNLSTKVREVLSMVVGSRMPASYVTLETLLVGRDKACDSAQELDQALTELEDRGLIGWDREANRYDAHPIVRGVIWQLTDAKDQQSVYTALEAHFAPMSIPEWDKVETLADLTSAIERYHTLVSLGRYDDASTVFETGLNLATLYRLPAHRERISWLERLFPNGLGEPPALTDENARSLILDALAMSYSFSDQPGRAVPLFRRADEIDKRINATPSRQVGLSNLGIALCSVGDFWGAEVALRNALVIARDLDDNFQERVILRELGRVLGSIGDSTLSLVALGRSQRLAIEESNYQGECLGSAYLSEVLLWFGNVVKASTLADRAWDLAANRRLERDFIRAALMQGRAALSQDERTRADERLHYAIGRTRAINMVEFELSALTAIAELELRRNHLVEARARLDDVWQAAERGPYPLHQADAYSVLAAIELAEENKPAAIDAATKAYKAAWCGGPPYAYHWGLQKAKAHLVALGAPEPDMPPFDESKFEPLPEVEINPKDKYWVDPDKLD
jgi:tetratricopeptide (TPR) repeat protein